MATMNDIARLAGVSQGTVSNVLNNRGNVSAKKIKLVQEAARRVGYIMNAPAHQLRSSSALSKTIGIILPNISDSRYAILYSALQSFWQGQGYLTSLWLTEDTPHYEKAAIAAATSARVSGIFTVTCLTDSADAYKTIPQYGGRVIYIEREAEGSVPYMGYDYAEAGYQIAGHLLKRGFHSAVLVAGLKFFSNERLFAEGFCRRMDSEPSKSFQYRIQEVYLAAAFQASFGLLEDSMPPECLVFSGKSLYDKAKQTVSAGFSNSLPPSFSIAFDCLDGWCDPNYYCMDYSALAEKASKLLLAALEKSKDPAERTILPARGFVPQFSPSFAVSGELSINVLLAQSQSASAIMQMTPQFTKETGIEVNYVTLPLEELTTVLSQTNGNHFFDVVRTNITTTPRFRDGALVPIPDSLFFELTSTMYPSVVSSFSYCHGQPCAVPFDINTYFYAYRKDLFSDSILRRTYLETYGEELCIPDNFKTYNQISAFFCRTKNPDSPVPYGTTGPSNDMALIFSHFLFIYHNLGGRLTDGENHFYLDREKASEAIRLQLELMPHSLSLEDPRRDASVFNFIHEKTAIEIISTSYASRLLDLKRSSINGVLGFAPLPGHTGTFGGGALAIPAGSQEKEAAQEYVRWACGYEQSCLFTLLGGTTPHKPVYQEYDILRLYPWFRLMDQTIETSYPLEELDIFDRYQLERFMGFTLRNIYCGVIPPEKSLDILEQGMVSHLLTPQ